MGIRASSTKRQSGKMALAHGNVHIIENREEFDAKIFEAAASGKVVVIDFTADWCGPCKFIAPFYEELSQNYPDLVFLKVDVDEHQSISHEYNILGMPTFIFLVNSQPAEKIVGANKAELEKKVKFYAEKSASSA